MTPKASLVLAVSSLCGILTAPLSAQTTHPVGRFDIPFQFAAGGKTMPAGEYTVDIRTVDGLVRIESKGDRHQAAFIATFPAEKAVSDNPKLTFHRYGDKYFLARISQQGSDSIRGLAASPAEREAAKAPSLAPVRAVVLAALPARR